MKQRLIYADLLRIMATFAVMILHLAASNWANVPLTSVDWQVFNLYDGLVRWCVPIFVMLSGMFFLDPQKDIPTPKLFSKYIWRIVTAYIFWSTLYALWVNWSIYHTISSDMIKGTLIQFIVGNYHLWFLFMIVGLYLITPFMRMITAQASRQMLTYFLVLFFFFGSILPMMASIPHLENIITTLTVNTGMHFVTWYVGFFLMGYYLKVYDFSKAAEGLIYLLGIAGLVATVWLTSLVSLKINAPTTLFYSYLAPNVVLSSAALFLFFKNHISKINWGPRGLKVISLLSGLSFGMYLVHDFFIILAAKLGLTTLAFNSFLAVPAIAIFVFMGSLIFAYLLSKLPIIKKISKYIM